MHSPSPPPSRTPTPTSDPLLTTSTTITTSLTQAKTSLTQLTAQINEIQEILYTTPDYNPLHKQPKVWKGKVWENPWRKAGRVEPGSTSMSVSYSASEGEEENEDGEDGGRKRRRTGEKDGETEESIDPNPGVEGVESESGRGEGRVVENPYRKMGIASSASTPTPNDSENENKEHGEENRKINGMKVKLGAKDLEVLGKRRQVQQTQGQQQPRFCERFLSVGRELDTLSDGGEDMEGSGHQLPTFHRTPSADFRKPFPNFENCLDENEAMGKEEIENHQATNSRQKRKRQRQEQQQPRFCERFLTGGRELETASLSDNSNERDEDVEMGEGVSIERSGDGSQSINANQGQQQQPRFCERFLVGGRELETADSSNDSSEEEDTEISEGSEVQEAGQNTNTTIPTPLFHGSPLTGRLGRDLDSDYSYQTDSNNNSDSNEDKLQDEVSKGIGTKRGRELNTGLNLNVGLELDVQNSLNEYGKRGVNVKFTGLKRRERHFWEEEVRQRGRRR